MVTHIAYELEALQRAAARPGKRLELEALLVHTRNLRDFFWKEWDPFDKFADSDVLAEHYFPSHLTWRGSKNKQPPTLERTWCAIDKQLAHITRDRLNPRVVQDLEAAAPALTRELLGQWERFLRKLGTDARRARFEAARAYWKAQP